MTQRLSLARPARAAFLAGFLIPLALAAAPRAGPRYDGAASPSPAPAESPTETAAPTETPPPTEPPVPATDTPTPTETGISPPEAPTETPPPTEPPVPTTDTPTPTETGTSSLETPTETAAPTETPPPTEPPVLTTDTPTPTSTETPSPTPTDTSAPPPATPYPPLSILINEVAWAGTRASSSDEWIELYNPGSTEIDLAGWVLTDNGDIRVLLAGSLPAGGFFLLERTDDTTVADIAADQICSGGLSNEGERLFLRDATGAVVDSANADGGGWPAGGGSSKASMERMGGEDIPGNWAAFNGLGGTGHDAAGNPIAGTPRQPNSILLSTPTPSPTSSAGPFPPLSILINEVAWAGTRAFSSDEWIELYNPGTADISLAGWTLIDDGDLVVNLAGLLPAGGLYLLERTDDTTVADVAADQIYSGGLSNEGEKLYLRDATGALIDSANVDGGGWPAGDVGSRASMERRGGDDRPGNWGTFTGYNGAGHDASGNPIAGTPRQANSLFFPTPLPTWIPGRVVINEVLIRPHYDWEGAGGVTSADEFIELYNLGPSAVFLLGWKLDDIPDGGSRPYTLSGVTISPGGYAVFFRSRTHIALNDSGDTVRLLAPDGQVIDQIRYLRVRAYNLSYGRLPDGSDHLAYGLWPTPRRSNLLFVEPTPPAPTLPSPACPEGGRPQPRLARLGRHPAVLRWLAALGHIVCR